ncbi:hypothetical protein [Pseudothermotoga sp.]|nr:hypothetical protein [Pseudothermotoga sp.]MDW8139777.1 hypothetical protein [Pseudothermotoga sp.]
MQRAIILIVVVLLFLTTCLALETENALKLYLNLVQEYESGSIQHPFLLQTVESLEHFSLYRFYRFLIAGSVDKREATPDLGHYLNFIYSSYNFEKEEEQLAAALFLSYLSSKLTRTHLTADEVMKNSSFIDFFTRYRDIVTKEARAFFAWVISYQLGLVAEKPPVDVEQRFQLEIADYVFNPPTSLQHLHDLALFYSDPAIQEVLSQAVQRAFENAKKDPTRILAHINREAAFVARDIVKPITNLQSKVAQLVQSSTPVRRNYWWMRFVLYGVVLLVSFKSLKARLFALNCVFVFETIYLFFLFDPTSKYESLFYGLVLVLGFTFSIFRLLRKSLRSVWLDVLSVTAIVFTAFLPFVYNCAELAMDRHERFLESKYYDLLKQELYMDELSKLSFHVRRLSSNMYTSSEDTKAILNDLVETLSGLRTQGIITDVIISRNYGAFFDDRSNFFSYTGSKARIETFQSLSNSLRFYLLDERSRKKAFERDLTSLTKYSTKLVSYAAFKLKEEFKNHLEDLFSVKYPILSDLQTSFLDRVFNNSKEVKAPHVSVVRNKRSLSILLISMFVFLTSFFLGPKISIGPAVVLLAVSIFGWSNSRDLILIVEQTAPLIEFQTNSFVNPLVFLSGIFIAVVNFLKLFRKGELR